jgi:uncharacterized protein YkwD
MIRFKTIIILCLVFIVSTNFYMRTAPRPEAKLSAEELKLYDLIMAYRKANKLPAIPLSVSLTYVAQQHCKDLFTNKPDLKKDCNAHSWSDKGAWKSCCYTPDHKQAECMWSKPAELTNYKSNGFEIACGSSQAVYKDFVMTAPYALDSWKASVHHNHVILNKDIWKAIKWNAIGIGIYKGFATVWFGEIVDADGEPAKS